MLILRLFGLFLAINLNLNLLYAANVTPFYHTNIDSFPEVFLDSVHIRVNNHWDISILLPENVSTSIVEKRLKLATRKNERNEKKIQFSLQSTGCH